MIALELRDSGAGIIVRSHLESDCVAFLRACLNRKRREAVSLRAFDPVSVAILDAEARRLEDLLLILADGAAGKEQGSQNK